MIALSEELDRHHVVHRRTNQVLGLLILAGGIALLLLVFMWAYHLYLGIGGEMVGVKPAVQAPVVPGTAAVPAPPPGTLTAAPGSGTQPVTAALILFARLCALLVMGWLAGLLASKGVALATGAPHKH